MPSANRLDANRANAQLSTGPQSIEGKAKVRYNSTRHGLAGKQVVIQGEDPAQYEALLEGLRESYRPVNTAEAILVEEIAQTFWRLQRARALEAEAFLMLSGGADPIIPFNAESARFDNIRRYMTTIERAHHRAIEQLTRMQANRKKEESQTPRPAVGFASQSTPIAVVREPALSEERRDRRIHRATIKIDPSPISAASS
jgi:hypothetical protein